MSKKVKKLIGYLVCAAVGAGMAVWYAFANGIKTAEPLSEKYRILCDAFTIPGIALLSVALLVLFSTMNAYDGIAFLLRNLRRSLIPGGRTKYPHETYYEFIEKRKERDKVKGYGFIAVTGAVFMAAAAVFLILFFKAYNAGI